MRKFIPLFLALILSACSVGGQSLTFPTATLEPATLAPTLAAQQTSVTAPAGETAPAATGGAADPFSENFLTLPAPDCTTLTPQQTEGPYYTPGSPERSILYEEGMAGEKLIVAGFVLDQNCQPIPGAWLDFWQADANGVYDNSGYTLRGHQVTDAKGRYFLETVIPGEYPGRTEHIHVKVQPPNGALITSQLYFPNLTANTSDGIYDPALLVKLEEREGLYVAYYNFVVTK